jgi:predicted lipoprotein with Yx(FWY)xxD motif
MTYSTVSWKALLVTVALTLPALAVAAEPAMMKNGMMVDQKGMTLYHFDSDKGGKSMCNEKCAENWPPMMAPADAKAEGKWTMIKRDDGKMQWAYDGKPMYNYKMDQKPGDALGDGKGGLWHMTQK